MQEQGPDAVTGVLVKRRGLGHRHTGRGLTKAEAEPRAMRPPAGAPQLPGSQPANTRTRTSGPRAGDRMNACHFTAQFVALGRGGQGQVGRQRLSWPGRPRRTATGKPARFPALQNS